ncbi:MAG TPA: single-stranded DNA-binding protein [Kiritimatiellia bacterium]|nr:single-stranded DNA-binding protein [Kiritimatiellia bacterium]
MASLNKVLLIGRLTRDPEKRSTPSGMAVAELGMAVNRRYKASNGEDREETCFLNVTVWGKTAELCAEYLRKGSPLFVEGRLKLDEWEKDGQKRSKLGVVAERVQFLDSGSRGGGGGGGGGRRDYSDAPDEPAPPRSRAAPAPHDDATPAEADDDLPF